MSAGDGADYILLERAGNKVRVKTAKGVFPQDVTGEIEMELPNTCYVGLFICSHEADVVEKANFTNVEYRLPKPAIVSILEILDVETGQRTTVREFDGLIEAPNWTPDGKWLIYNSGGSLYRLSPDKAGEPELIDTDFAVNCNNDHVVSFDGSFIAISNSPVEDRRSHIYTVPVEGGTPRLVTPVGPSYLHGVSPDGRTLAYCADRGGNYDVYAIASEGGREVRLTTAEDLDDGPEYSPDGEYIWFNSVRSGLMQVWRMKADGSEQTQMTFDETRNSWFPHVSPDNRQVVFITYNKGDLKPNEHLANKNVELRLMPAGGGEPRTLAKLFGGQGTINVNSWAPDSRRLAFVSYRLIP
jgi:Tol biopolymer transport system component